MASASLANISAAVILPACFNCSFTLANTCQYKARCASGRRVLRPSRLASR
ncbi:Uncharacterised protein [Bordetella pertussis]|nr:Uncharacterised protein [Bordetella pertussis]